MFVQAKGAYKAHGGIAGWQAGVGRRVAAQWHGRGKGEEGGRSGRRRGRRQGGRQDTGIESRQAAAMCNAGSGTCSTAACVRR